MAQISNGFRSGQYSDRQTNQEILTELTGIQGWERAEHACRAFERAEHERAERNF